MKITCDRTMLQSAFATVSGVVPTRTPKPVLQYVKVQAMPGQVTLLATDQEVGVRHILSEATVVVGGEVLLPKKEAGDILRELQGQSATIEKSGEHLWICGDRSEYELQVANPEEFPSIPEFDARSYYNIPSDSLKKLIRRTMFACDVESTKYALGGVLFDFKPPALTLVATDTRRLASATGTCEAVGTVEQVNQAPVVPAKAMSLLERMLSDEPQPVSVSVSLNSVLFKCGATTLYARLVEGRFPNYQNVIPKESQYEVEAVAGPFYSAVRQSQIVTNPESRGVKFTFLPGNLTLSSQAANIGQSRVEVPVGYDGPEMTLIFDPRYVAEFLRVLDSEQTFQLKIKNSQSSVMAETEDSYRYVIMPLAQDAKPAKPAAP